MQELFDDRTLKLIRERVKRLIGRHGFTASDRDDLEQDMTLHLLECLRRQQQLIDAPEGFFRKVVARHAVTLIRRRKAEKRDHRRLNSLHEKVLDEDGEYVERARTILENHTQSRLQTVPAVAWMRWNWSMTWPPSWPSCRQSCATCASG